VIPSLKGPGEVEAEILMTRQAFAGAFLVLEGPDDSRFWSSRLVANQCEIVIAGGKPAVVGGVGRLDARRFRGAVGVVDDDCDRLLGNASGSANLIRTDVRDLECILVRSGAFNKVLAEFGEPRKIARFVASGRDIRNVLVELALPLGRLRWYSYQAGVGVDFRKLIAQRFVDEASWTFDEDALLDAASAQPGVPVRASLVADLNALISADVWQVCHGHDLIDLLGLGLARVLGNKNPGRERIGSVLRSGLDNTELRGLQIHRDLRQWEVSNAPYRVLG